MENPIRESIATTSYENFKTQGPVPKTLGQQSKIYLLFHRKAIQKRLLEGLKNISSKDMHKNIDSAAIIDESKVFLKKVLCSRFCFFKNEQQQFSKALCAARLGVPLEALEKNPGFQQVIEKNFFMRPIADVYKHSIEYNAQTGQLKLLMEGKVTDWKTIKEKLKPDPQSGKVSGWSYTYEGFIPHDPSDWSELKPYMILPEKDRPPTHEIEIVTDCYREDLHDKGLQFWDHTWIRLKTPSGEVYSFGLYPEDVLVQSKKNMLATTKGIIKCPDRQEFLPRVLYQARSMSISEEVFHNIKKQVESKEYKQSLEYSVLGNNCTDFSIQLLKEAGVSVKGLREKVDVEELISSKVQQSKIKKKMIRGLSKPIMKMMGRGRRIGQLKQLEKGQKPHSDGLKTVTLAHPRAMRQWMIKDKTLIPSRID